MVLVDTSVLIDFFRCGKSAGVKKFESLLGSKVVFGINDLIYLEVLQGASTATDFKTLKSYLDTQIFYGLKNGRNSFAAAAELYMLCRKAGITVSSTIDFLIVQTAIENNLYLLHSDRDYEMIRKAVPELKFY